MRGQRGTTSLAAYRPLIRPSVRTGPPSPQGEGFGDGGYGLPRRCAPRNDPRGDGGSGGFRTRPYGYTGLCVGRDDHGAPNPIIVNPSVNSVGADLCVGPAAPPATLWSSPRFGRTHRCAPTDSLRPSVRTGAPPSKREAFLRPPPGRLPLRGSCRAKRD
jgi:hypothetical protein